MCRGYFFEIHVFSPKISCLCCTRLFLRKTLFKKSSSLATSTQCVFPFYCIYFISLTLNRFLEFLFHVLRLFSPTFHDNLPQYIWTLLSPFFPLRWLVPQSKPKMQRALGVGLTLVAFNIWYSYSRQGRPFVDPNGHSSYALPSYENLQRAGIQSPVHPDLSAILNDHSDYAHFKRIYNFQSKFFPSFIKLPPQFLKPEFMKQLNYENELIRARAERDALVDNSSY